METYNRITGHKITYPNKHSTMHVSTEPIYKPFSHLYILHCAKRAYINTRMLY